MMQPDANRYRNALLFSAVAFVVTALGAIVTFALGLQVLGVALVALALLDVVNVAIIGRQVRNRQRNGPFPDS